MVKPKWYWPKDAPYLPERAIIRFAIEIGTTKEDSVEILAHGLAGDIVDALTNKHQVGCRIQLATVNGHNVYAEKKP